MKNKTNAQMSNQLRVTREKLQNLFEDARKNINVSAIIDRNLIEAMIKNIQDCEELVNYKFK